MNHKLSLKQFYRRFETFIKYTLYGCGTSALNFGIFFLFTRFVHDPNRLVLGVQYWELINILSWIIANIYSYYANRRYVFHSENDTRGSIFRETVVFFGSRLFSFLIASYVMSLLINYLQLDHSLTKLIGVTIEVILNYFSCKFLIFRHKKPRSEEDSGL